MGLTALFLYWDTTIAHASNAAVSVLFGSLFVLNRALIVPVALLSLVALLLIAAVYRWLLIESVQEDLAVARGVPVRLAGVVFLIALALAVELSSLTIGAILSTALLIGPASTALLMTRRFGRAIWLSAGLGRRGHLGGVSAVLRELRVGGAEGQLARELLHRRPRLPAVPRDAHRRGLRRRRRPRAGIDPDVTV